MSEFFFRTFTVKKYHRAYKQALEQCFQKTLKIFLIKKNIEYNQSYCFSTPNRLLIFFKEIKKEVIQNLKKLEVQI